MFGRLLVVAAFALLPAVGVSAQQPVTPPSPPPGAPAAARLPFDAVITVGAAATNSDDYLGRVGEYDVLHQGTVPALGLQAWGERGNSRFDAFARYGGDVRDQRYGIDVNLHRRLKATISYDRTPHRLDHDPLTWMDASSNLGGTFVVGHTDNDPSAQYALTRGELKSRLELAVPLSRHGSVALYASHRQEMRDGTHQALTTNHCATCHTESFTRRIDQRTRDLVAGARVQLRAVTLDYSVMNREFKEDAAVLQNIYNRARQPATLADVFLNRVSYDERDGPLSFDTVPGLRKNTHELRARVSLPKDASVSGTFTQSSSRNLDTNVGVDYTGASGRLAVPLGRKLILRAAVKRYDIDADSAFVDVDEPVAPAGPAAGLTYAQAFPQLGEIDYERLGLSRTPTNFEVDLIYRPWKKTAIRGGYEWESIERGGDAAIEQTTSTTLRASVRSSPWKQIQLQARGVYEWTKDPFVRERAAMPAVLQPYASPGNLPFAGLQYFEFYRTRQANLTNYPVRDGLFEESLTWTADQHVSITAHYRYRRALNDELNFSQWHQSSHVPGAQIWIAPGGPVTLSAGYTYQKEETETGFATLAFVG